LEHEKELTDKITTILTVNNCLYLSAALHDQWRCNDKCYDDL